MGGGTSTRGVGARARATAMAAALVLGATACGGGGGGEDRLDVLALGDSFSSGEGASSSDKECGRSDTALGAQVAERLEADDRLGRFELAACTGARLDDVAAQIDAADGARHDLVTLSVGGNDAGYAEVLIDCLGADEIAARILDGADAAIRGCTIGAEELDDRARGLSERLTETYQRIVDDLLSEDGRLVVLTYPHLFEDPDAWVDAEDERCDGVSRADVVLLRDAGATLAEVIQEAAAGVERTTVVDTRATFEGHGRCGAEPWINGVTIRPRLRSSFHPNDDGHTALADLVEAELGS